jgi:periplasmic protein TonB
MSGTVQTASPFLDEPGRRFVWVAPLSITIWAALLLLFSLLLEQTAPPLPELKPVEAQIVELPPTVAGLQGAPAPPVAPLTPKPRVEVKRKIVRLFRPHKARTIPELAPSPLGVRKAPAESEPAPSAPPSKATTGEATNGPPNESGSGGSSARGSDNLGARAIYAPVPEIPDDLREEIFAAVAVAHFEVTYDGTVKVSLIKPTSNPRLNEIILETLKQWRFFPAMKAGVAIDSAFDVRIPISVQ